MGGSVVMTEDQKQEVLRLATLCIRAFSKIPSLPEEVEISELITYFEKRDEYVTFRNELTDYLGTIKD